MFDFVKRTFTKLIAESISSDDGSRMNNHTILQFAVSVEDDIGIELNIISQSRVFANCNIGMYLASGTNSTIRRDHHMRADIGIGTYDCGAIDHCSRMNLGSRLCG